MIDIEHMQNPEGHATINPAPFGPIGNSNPHPVEERPIVIHYSNEHPFALTKVTIFGKELNPTDYIIGARDRTITLKYNFSKVYVKVDDE